MWRDLYPFESREIRIDGYRYHYLDEGSGAPVVMVHGNPTWSFYWRNLVTALRDDHRVIVPDHLGCGLSDKPQGYPYRLERHIENLGKLFDELDLRDVTLAVHDWGGPIGLGAALARPARISNLVFFNTGAFPPPYIPLRIRLCRTPGVGTLAMRGLNLFSRAAIHMATNKPERMTAPVRAGLLAPYDRWSNRVAVDRFVRDIPASTQHPTWPLLESIENRLGEFADRPVLMIWGMRDWCFRPECLDRLIKWFPEAEVHRLEDAGHYVVEDAHETIVPLVRGFLRNAVGTRP